jgi:hypothetical protein
MTKMDNDLQAEGPVPPVRPTIAVVAVHGVGQHAPGDSARQVMELLLRLRHDGEALENRYTSFRESPVSIPVRPAHVSPRSAPEELSPQGTPPDGGDKSATSAGVPWAERFREQSDYVAHRHAGRGRFDRTTDGLDFQFMRAQLAEYRSDGAPYETMRFEGQRLPAGRPTEPETDVHIYEMHWSNLGRMKWGLLQIGQEFYQLLFHITNLGRQTIDHARIEHEGSRVWAIYSAIQTWTVRLFTLLLPIAWLTMLSTVLTIVPVARRLQGWPGGSSHSPSPSEPDVGRYIGRARDDRSRSSSRPSCSCW